MDFLEDINKYINDGDYERAIEELNLLIYKIIILNELQICIA